MHKMRLLIALILLLTAGSLVESRPVYGQNSKAKTKMVRAVYLVSSDRKESPEYRKAIEDAVMILQGWYSQQLGGPTFRVHSPVVEVVKSTQLAKWFYSNPNDPDPENWGYYNTLKEAEKLLGACQNDPDFIWVIYSDGPGDKGRGGSGVTCLPEEDLIGLVGKHPTYPSVARWVGGLGHELGHAFGLSHPADTTKDADAIMWMGLYEKFPGGCYLTERDKRILMQSPFFFDSKGGSVAEKIDKNSVFTEKFDYSGGYFAHTSGAGTENWKEGKTDSSEINFFQEFARGDRFIILKATDREMMIGLPVKGGRSLFSTDEGKSWNPLYEVKKK